MRRGQQRGATYVVLMIAVAVLATATARVAQSWTLSEQRQKEEALRFVGDQYRRAIERYYQATPGPHKRLPLSVDELLLDSRFAQPVRHLRQHYVDPISGRDDWLWVRSPMNELVGVRSASEKRPHKRTGFSSDEVAFDAAEHYTDWYFVYVPPPLAGVAGLRRER